ncbi:MAG: DUF4190 domain-containing protein [Actinomycetes bacterium]
MRETEQNAVWALVCAIGSWFVVPFVLAIVALVLAANANRAIAASAGYKDGQGMVQAARIIAWANLVLFGLLLLAGLVAGVALIAESEPA